MISVIKYFHSPSCRQVITTLSILGSVRPLEMQQCFLLLRMDGLDNRPIGGHDSMILQDLGHLVKIFLYIIYTMHYKNIYYILYNIYYILNIICIIVNFNLSHLMIHINFLLKFCGTPKSIFFADLTKR